MASTINATTNGIVNIGDSVATLALQTGGTTAVAIDTAQIVTLSKSLALLGSTSGSVTIAAPAVAGTQSYTLPTAVPASNGYALTSTTAGVMSWAASGGSPGGTNTQFQYNNSSAFAGAANLVYNANGPIVSSLGVGSTTPSASGAGIAFPATQSASTDANTLDDYEEGTWTPGVSFGNGTTGITYHASTSGFYRKVGTLVTLTGYVQLTNKGSSTGVAKVTGLPFTSELGTGEQGDFGCGIGYTNNITYVGQFVIYGGGGTILLPIQLNAGTPSNLNDTAFSNTTLFVISGSYVSTT